MPVTLVTSSTVTGAQITLDTSGVDLVVAIMNGHADPAPMPIADNKANGWSTPISRNSGTGRSGLTISYFRGGAVGTGHVFTKNNNDDDFGDFSILGYAGLAASPLDVSISALSATTGTTSQPGSITTTQNGDLIITAVSLDDGALSSGQVTIDSGFTQRGFAPEVPGSEYGLFVADLVQASAGAINPTVTRAVVRNGAGPDVHAIIAFKAASTGSTVALSASTRTAVTARIGFRGKAAFTAKGNHMLFARAAPAGRVPLIGRATALAMARAQASATVGLQAASRTASSATAAPRGVVPLAARTATQVKVLANVNGLVALAARGVTAVRAIATPIVKAALSARSAVKTSATAQPSGTVSLAARTAATIQARAGLTTGGLVALVARSATMVRAALGAPTGKAALSARSTLAASARAQPAAVVGLSARTSATTRVLAAIATRSFVALTARCAISVRAVLGPPTGKAAISATARTQTTARAGISGSAALAASTQTKTSAGGVLGGFTIPVALFARTMLAITSRAQLRIFQPPPINIPKGTLWMRMRLERIVSRAVETHWGEECRFMPMVPNEFTAPEPDPDRSIVTGIKGIFTLEPGDDTDLRGQRLRGEFSGVTRVDLPKPRLKVTAEQAAKIGYQPRHGDRVALTDRPGQPTYDIADVEVQDDGDLLIYLTQ